MKRLLASIALMAASIVCAGPAPYPLTVNSRAQTAPPVIAYAGNETVYRVSYTDGDTASAISAGEIPFMAWATNNAAAVNSTSSYAIVAGTTGVVDFTFSPAAVNFAAGRYIYETGVKASNGNNRVYRQGTFQIYGSPVGSGVASVTWTTNMNWAAINWQNLPTWLSTPAVTPAQTSGWVTASHAGFITTNDAESIVFNALFTNRVTRWYDPELSTRWAEWDGGTNIVIYKAEVSGTNFVVTFSSDFEETTTHNTLIGPWPFPFVLNDWFGEGWSEGLPASIGYNSGVAQWIGTIDPPEYPIFLIPAKNAQGTATVSIASFNLTTNVEWRYVLPTNAIPPELANLDNLQGWLNNLYAGKTAFDGHVTDGTHTNVTLAGTVTIGGVARTDWPAGTPGAITNGQEDVRLGSATFSANSGVTLTNAATGAKLELRANSGDTWSVIDSKGNLDFKSAGVDVLYLDSGSLNAFNGKGIGFGSSGDIFFYSDGADFIARTRRYGGSGNFRIPEGDLKLETGVFKFGPIISTKQAHVFSDGTNMFFVNVNSVTNALTTN